MLELFSSACGAGMCIALMMLIAKEFYHSLAARIFFVLIFCAFVYFCHNWLPKEFSAYAYMVESAGPAFFWMSCRLIFQESNSLPRLGLFISIYSFTVPVIKHLLTLYLGMTPDWLAFLGRELTQYCEYILVVMGIFSLLTGQGDDLVESRRRLRWAIMGASGLSLGWAVFSFNLNLGSDLSRILAIDLSVLIVIWSLFKGRQDIWGQVTPAFKSGLPLNNEVMVPIGDDGIFGAASTKQDVNTAEGLAVELEKPSLMEAAVESEALKQVKTLMMEGFYRQENLTLKHLALAMKIPEYKARAIINKELGYRNFNEFINEYRINEAAQRLITEPDTPISNIALDVGYRTLSSFNRAFRKEKDTTPTAFRDK
jgi:AraC-like DNA-binding protein